MEFSQQQNQARERLDFYYQAVSSIILSRQNPCTGLVPASTAVNTHGDYRDAWVRDNVYSIYSVWGLSLAYRRLDDLDGRAYELEHAVIKNMRGLLFCMMRQAHKVEMFKNTQAVENSLHAKYNTATGDIVVGDREWGHLQLDATAIFLLALAQMTSSGLQIIYTHDEVHFIQNLVFYIERAYRTPDYGIWERGNKINHGNAELNSSSIGMCVAALQAINGINLFGARGGPTSVIHCMADEITRNYTTLQSALPRESNSKEIDAALLSVIGFPAFAVHDKKLADKARNEIIRKLGGRYGCKRFLRDGHQTVLEDTSRLHYDAAELKMFEHIESEWPLFFTYLILDAIFRNDQEQAEVYRKALEPCLVSPDEAASLLAGGHKHGSSSSLHPLDSPGSKTNAKLDGTPSPINTTAPAISSPLKESHTSSWASTEKSDKNVMKLVPELYIVPIEKVDAEKAKPKSQDRVPNENIPLVWAQSLYILGELLREDLLSPAELDPLGRRLNAEMISRRQETVVQVVILAEDAKLQQTLAMYGVESQTVKQAAPITISTATTLREVYARLGQNSKLGLTGRPRRPVGTLATCKIYRFMGQLYAFLPHFMDRQEFYLINDNDYLVTMFEHELRFVQKHWHLNGRPTLVVMLTHSMFGNSVSRLKVLGQPVTPVTATGTSPNNIPPPILTQAQNQPRGDRKTLLNFVASLRSGNFGGVRIRVGRIGELVHTANIDSLDFLIHHQSDIGEIRGLLSQSYHAHQGTSKLHLNEKATTGAGSREKRRTIKRKSRYIRDALAENGPHVRQRSAGGSSGDVPSSYSGRSVLTSPVTTDEGRSDSEAEDYKLKEHDESAPQNRNRQPSGQDIPPIDTARGMPSNRSSLAFINETTSPTTESPKHRRTRSYVFDTSEDPNKHRGSTDASIASAVSVAESDLSNDMNALPGITVPTGESMGSNEMLTLTLHDPTHIPAAVNLLLSSVNLYDQVDLLHYLYSCRGPEYRVERLGSVFDLLEEVYVKATQLKLWTIVRQAAGLTKKVVNNLTISITDLLIRQKPVSVGYGHMEYMFVTPMSPSHLFHLIYAHCTSDAREAPLVQEVITYLGSLIRSRPSMFEGISRIRVHYFIIAMREEISRIKNCNEEEAVEHLMQLSPFEVKSLLSQVLTAHEQTTSTSITSTAGIDPITVPRNVPLTPRLTKNTRNDALISPTSASGPSLKSTVNSIKVSLQSGGFLAGNFALVEILRDGKPYHAQGLASRGLNVIIIDHERGTVTDITAYDTHFSRDDSMEFARLVQNLEVGTIVAIVVKDDCCENLCEAAKSALESLGAAQAREIGYRDSYCLIGEKGAPRGTVVEQLKKANAGPTETLTKVFDLALKRRRQSIQQGLLNLGFGNPSSPKSATQEPQMDAPTSTTMPNFNDITVHNTGPSGGRWLRRRKTDGALNRVPRDFYPRVWYILNRCHGIRIGRAFLPREPTISEKTPEEFNFALQVENALDAIRDPAERIIVVELLVVIHGIMERNPEARPSNEVIDLLRIIRESVAQFWKKSMLEIIKIQKEKEGEDLERQTRNMAQPEVIPDEWKFEKHERLAKRLFFDLPQDGQNGTLGYLASSCIKHFANDIPNADVGQCQVS